MVQKACNSMPCGAPGGLMTNDFNCAGLGAALPLRSQHPEKLLRRKLQLLKLFGADRNLERGDVTLLVDETIEQRGLQAFFEAQLSH